MAQLQEHVSHKPFTEGSLSHYQGTETGDATSSSEVLEKMLR